MTRPAGESVVCSLSAKLTATVRLTSGRWIARHGGSPVTAAAGRAAAGSAIATQHQDDVAEPLARRDLPRRVVSRRAEVQGVAHQRLAVVAVSRSCCRGPPGVAAAGATGTTPRRPRRGSSAASRSTSERTPRSCHVSRSGCWPNACVSPSIDRFTRLSLNTSAASRIPSPPVRGSESSSNAWHWSMNTDGPSGRATSAWCSRTSGTAGLVLP